MHELSIASTLVENVLEFVEANRINQVLAVRVAVGELIGVETEQLRFCYAAVTAETALAGSSLEIEKVQAEVNCSHCSYRGSPKYWEGALSATPVPTLQCPGCGKAAEAVQGQECSIRTVKYVA
jgi:hydrogenase nickel incorporation protein HypA/HybF